MTAKSIRRKAIKYQNAQYPKKIPFAEAIRHVQIIDGNMVQPTVPPKRG